MFVDILFMLAIVLVFGPLVWNKIYGKSEDIFGTVNRRHNAIVV